MFIAALLAFFSCSFLGWLLEAVWLWTHKEHIIKGVLHPLPLKPIYGLGGTFVVLAGPYLQHLPLLLQWFWLSFLLGGFEALGGLWNHKVNKRRLWRYEGTFLNVYGYTDGFHAAVWGLIAMAILHLT